MQAHSRTVRPHDPEAGFTLVESMTAIVILIFGLMAVTNLMLVSASSNTVANQSSAATAIASSIMDQLRATSFQNIAVGGNLAADAPGFSRDDQVRGVGTIHSRWQVVVIGTDGRALFITVRSEGLAPLAGARSRAQFTTYRTCTNLNAGCT